MVWVRGAAIRPVPAYAVIDEALLVQLEHELGADRDGARLTLSEAYARFERLQPRLAESVAAMLNRPLDETALGLGYFLTMGLWVVFERAFSTRVREVDADALRATEDALALEEELRARHADEPIDLEDVVAIEQPGILAFVNRHVEVALDVTGRSESGGADDGDVDVDDVHLVYRMVLVLTLALSHAVAPPDGSPPETLSEILA